MYSIVHMGEEAERRVGAAHMEVVAFVDVVVEDKDTAVGERSGDSDMAALHLAAAQAHSEPSGENGAELVDRCRSRRSCYEYSHSGRGIVDREAFSQHTLVDQGQVLGESSQLSQSRRRPSQDVVRAAPFAGVGTHSAAIALLYEMAHDV